MRRLLLLAAVLGTTLLSAPALASPTGGADSGTDPGGAAYDSAAPVPLRVRAFTLRPAKLATGARARAVLRVDGPVATVSVRIDVLAAGTRRLVQRVRLGTWRTGRRTRIHWALRGGASGAGEYVARLHLTGPRGERPPRAPRRALRIEAPPAPSAPSAPSAMPRPVAPAPVTPGGRFPVQGPYSLGGAEAVFGAPRAGRSHQGQDIAAAEGTPVVSPLAGVVHWRAYQADGAGHYLVVRATDGRDLAFMHLQAGSLAVAKGDRVRAGQPVAAIGTTGSSSGPHLHFEIWTGGWWEAGGIAIDPLPQLQAWARGN